MTTPLGPAPGLPDARVRWLRAEEQRLLDWGARAVDDLGFGYLDSTGRIDETAGHPLLVTARMTYVFAIAARRGRSDAAGLRDHGVRALLDRFPDREHGGWVSQLERPLGRKSGYDHAFVLLAAAAVRDAGTEGAALFDAAAAIVQERFWRADEGAIADSFAADWSDPEPYRGANANMHLVEAFLAAWAATADADWLRKAGRIAERLIHGAARSHGWRIPEHFDEHWRPLLRYNADRPEDQFRPYGYLVGHSFEWARLLVQLSDAFSSCGRESPRWLGDAATALWERALEVGWSPDSRAGFVYSLDWEDRVVVDARLHWVVSEAAGAAAALARRGVPGAAVWGERIWADIESRFADPAGSWHHELDAAGRPSARVWPGKPDLYHAYQAVVSAQGEA
ncbi:AGE family epimerase/isomerase [Microbacterium album]|uniref:N-acylglucosamine 2-epimerase n=1 Tax=Microbacterium album TaxID=2053191 RepID=A0A917IJ05_9MICO|nr:AGE family epimerase/isomerase [Microbacterium album]GGH50196.1 N-acylglucosamine 2-epimerase [Microbacterium album]